MFRILPILGLVVLAVVLVAADGERSPEETTTRYFLTIVRQDAGATGEGTPLKLAELGSPAAPVGAKAANLTADGFVAAVPHSTKILEAVRARGAADVLYRGECEVQLGRKGVWISGTRVPVPVVSLRGNQPTVSTMYEETGVKLEVERLPHTDRVNTHIEFSAIRRLNRQIGSIIDKHSTHGTVLLPDGYTGIYTFLDRVPAEILNRMPEGLATDDPPASDLVTQYFVLLTRMDVAASR